jgi:two-component system sensor histidine kinase/response regulator
MNGRIWVESEVGRGSVFHFTVVVGVFATPEEERVRARFGDLQNLPVLVVDDNATNRRILKDMLTHWGMAPTLAASAAEALALIQKAAQEGRTYKLVLTDANMPEVDGFELASQVKGHPGYGDVVIMMLSSSGFRGDSALCRKIGLSAYLTKPVKQSQLLDAIMLALGSAAEPAADAPLITRHSLSRSHEHYSILLAEDNIINQKLAVHVLENRGHKVTVANSGKEALEELERGTFDLVLMDVQMPEMDGFQATAAIRSREAGTGVRLPIVAMTAHAMAGDRERCLQAGMDDYVSKPLKPIDLFQTIDRAIENSRRRANSP